jgi:hypothetical protein
VVYLDIVLHPDYAKNGWIYITYASTEGGGEGGILNSLEPN